MVSSDESTAGTNRRKDPDDDNDEDDDAESSSSSSSDKLLFKFPHRPFKRSAEERDSCGSESGEESGGSGSEDIDDAFNSPPDSSRVGGGGVGNGLDSEDDLNSLSSSGEEPEPKKRQKIMTSAEVEEASNAVVDALLKGDEDGNGWGDRDSVTKSKKDEDYSRSLEKKIADAANIEAGATSRVPSSSGPSKAASMFSAVSAQTAARRAREQDAKRVKLTVVRSRRQRHVFKTTLGKRVEVVELNCRGEVNLLTRDEEHDAEVALYYEDRKLDSSKTLREEGIPAGQVTLRLEVICDSVDGAASGAAAGPPITLKVRVEGGKTFSVGTTIETKFSAFIEGFHAAIGIPLDRAGESVFKFDGDRLNPDGTPEDEDMEPDEVIDASFPKDLMDGVRAAPNEVTLGVPKKEKLERKGGKGKGKRADRSETEAALAAIARPLGGAAASSKSAREDTRRSGCSSEGSGTGPGLKEPDVILLD